MSWIVLTDDDDDPVLINADIISCIYTSDKIPNGSIIWLMNDDEVIDVKESLAEIYAQMSSPHSICELLDRYNSNEPIMQEIPKTKPKITRWEKFWKSVNPDKYREYLCDAVECIKCPAFGTACLDKQQFKAYMLEEVEDE